MPRLGFGARVRAIVRAWPPAGALFLVLSFFVTLVWLYDGMFVPYGDGLGWLEPLAAMLAGLGAFVLAAILIFRRVDSAREAAETYDLARGLATGYYFNYVRPLVGALSDPKHPVHAELLAWGGYRVVGAVVGIPQAVADFEVARHDALLAPLTSGPGKPFVLRKIEIEIEGRPRPLSTKVALSSETKTAVMVDIPTTLAVIPDFAAWVARHGPDASDDEFVSEARLEMVAAAETGQFRAVLEKFIDVVSRAGSLEPQGLSPATLLHLVSIDRLRRRVDELANH